MMVQKKKKSVTSVMMALTKVYFVCFLFLYRPMYLCFPQFSPLFLFYSFKSVPSVASKKFLPETNMGPQLPSLR